MLQMVTQLFVSTFSTLIFCLTNPQFLLRPFLEPFSPWLLLQLLICLRASLYIVCTKVVYTYSVDIIIMMYFKY